MIIGNDTIDIDPGAECMLRCWLRMVVGGWSQGPQLMFGYTTCVCVMEARGINIWTKTRKRSLKKEKKKLQMTVASSSGGSGGGGGDDDGDNVDGMRGNRLQPRCWLLPYGGPCLLLPTTWNIVPVLNDPGRSYLGDCCIAPSLLHRTLMTPVLRVLNTLIILVVLVHGERKRRGENDE